jgi:hypothetical protein
VTGHQLHEGGVRGLGIAGRERGRAVDDPAPGEHEDSALSPLDASTTRRSRRLSGSSSPSTKPATQTPMISAVERDADTDRD